MDIYGCQSRLVCASRPDRTSFAPETTRSATTAVGLKQEDSKINEADRYPTWSIFAG